MGLRQSVMTDQTVTSSQSEPTKMWDDSLQKITENKNALRIIKILAYLPTVCEEFFELFSHIIKDEKQLSEAIDLLQEHSMICVDKRKDTSKIDRLVQDEIRKKLVENGEEIEVLKSALLLLDTYDKFVHKKEQIHKITIFTSNLQEDNLESVFSYGSKYKSLIELFYKNIYCRSFSPLHFLAQSGNIFTITRIVEFLKTYRQEEFLDVINAVNKNNETCLLLAVKFKFDFGVIKYLIKNGVNVNVIDYKNKSILHYAVKLCTLEIVQLLIDNGVNANVEDISTLHYAATLNDLRIFNLLLENGANVYVVDHENKTILHYAAELCNFELVKSLIEHGANVNAVDKRKIDILHLAIASRNDKIPIESKNMTIKYLIDQGANINNNLLMLALRRNNFDIAEYLIANNGGSIFIIDKYNTILNVAAELDNFNFFQYLLRDENIQRIDINAVNAFGQTPIFVAMFHRNLDHVRFLFSKRNEFNLKLTYKNNAGITISLLHAAIASDNLEIIELIIKNEFDQSERFNVLEDIPFVCNNVSALDIAVLFNSRKVMRYFIELNELCRVKFNEISEFFSKQNIILDDHFLILRSKQALGVYKNEEVVLREIVKLSNYLEDNITSPIEDFDFYT